MEITSAKIKVELLFLKQKKQNTYTYMVDASVGILVNRMRLWVYDQGDKDLKSHYLMGCF